MTAYFVQPQHCKPCELGRRPGLSDVNIGCVATADELRAFGVAAEADGDVAAGIAAYKDELRVRLTIFCDTVAGGYEQHSDEVTSCVLELARSSESLARMHAANGSPETEIVAISLRLLKCASAALHEDHPVVAGIKVHLGDSCMVFAKQCEAQRLSALRDPDSTQYDQTESDEWRRKLVQLVTERNGFVKDAHNYYTEAVVSYRVFAALSKPEEQRDEDINGIFGSHVCHCLVKIAEGHALSDEGERALDYKVRAEHEYNIFSDRHCGDTINATSASAQCVESAVSDFSPTMPYCSGFEYSNVTTNPLEPTPPLGKLANISLLLSHMGVGADETDSLLYGNITFLPTVAEVLDTLATHEATLLHLRRAQELSPQFLTLLRNPKSDQWLRLLRQAPLLPFLARLEEEAEGDTPPVILLESPYSEILSERCEESLSYYGHLRVYSSLSDREIAKYHGNDWEKKVGRFKIPLLEAIEGRNEAAVTTLLAMGVHPLACSPHDMRSALPTAIDVGDLSACKTLLQHKAITLEDEPHCYELASERVGVNIDCKVTTVPLAREKRRTLCAKTELPFPFLWEMVMSQPKEKVAKWYAENADMFLTKLNSKGTAAVALMKDAFGGYGLLSPFLPDALRRIIALGLEELDEAALAMTTYNQKLELACKTNDLHLATVLFTIVSVNSIWHGHPLVEYHIERGNLDIIRSINDHCDFDETLLSKEALLRLDQLVDRWGLNLLT